MGARDVAQVVGSFSSAQETLGLSSSTICSQTGCPKPQSSGGARKEAAQGYGWLLGKIDTSLHYMEALVLKQTDKT